MKSIYEPLNRNNPKLKCLPLFCWAFRTAAKHIFNTLFILNVINEKKQVLNTERNNIYLVEASISPHFTATCDFDKYTITLHFGGKHHQNLCHTEIKDHRQILYFSQDTLQS